MADRSTDGPCQRRANAHAPNARLCRVEDFSVQGVRDVLRGATRPPASPSYAHVRRLIWYAQ